MTQETMIQTNSSVEAPRYLIDYPEDLWNEIVPGLFMGGTNDDDTIHEIDRPNVCDITKKDFDTCVTAYAWANPADWEVKELRYGFYDSTLNPKDLREIFDVVRIAHADWKRGKRVLVRCQAGLNRSGLITALILMREGYSADEAINLIREKRSPHALFNKSFVAWLRKQPSKK